MTGLQTSLVDMSASPAATAYPGYALSNTRPVPRSAARAAMKRVRTAVAGVVIGTVGIACTVTGPSAANASSSTAVAAPIASSHLVPTLDPKAELAAQILSYQHLDADWDGDGAVVPSKEAIEDALAILDLIPVSSDAPAAMVESRGDIGLFWQAPTTYIDLSFKGDQTIVYYGHALSRTDDRTQLVASGVAPYNRKSLPKDLMAVILSA
ncbi:hypothetical protein SAMN02745157_1552 [Kaistia soli DSM 19436]|uniref:Uncharacterized protein n=1 Tax=Kaistia soli DSM 19436 TaxID=1122133 RepID=A0A1M4YL16_9HYPH|nr:hypothetical protein SAMN02745157_1552 [Kaistia soli DSM 19436]